MHSHTVHLALSALLIWCTVCGYRWGLDSFRGLPAEVTGREAASTRSLWRKGAFASDPRDKLTRQLGGPSRVDWIAGFFNESLRDDDLVRRRKLKPARYIDMDADIYVSSRDALDFFFRNRLARPGTLIGYDDWWVLPCGPGEASTSPLDVGEGRAHAEVAAKFGVHFACVAAGCLPPPSDDAEAPTTLFTWGALFLVVAIDGTRKSHDIGFPANFSSDELAAYKRHVPSCTCRAVAKRERECMFGRVETRIGGRGGGPERAG